MAQVLMVRFVIERRPGGGFSATLRDSTRHFEAETLPELQTLLSCFARSLIEGSGSKPIPILVRRVRPTNRAQA